MSIRCFQINDTINVPTAVTKMKIFAYFQPPKIYTGKNMFAFLFSVHNTTSLSRHKQISFVRLRLERCFSHHRAILASLNIIASLNILVHYVINLLYYKNIYSLKKSFVCNYGTILRIIIIGKEMIK